MHRSEITNTEQHNRLSVLIHQDGLSFYIHNASVISTVVHRTFKYPSNPIEVLDSIKDCFETEDSLKNNFEVVKLIYHHPIFSMVPSTIFNEKHVADYLKYNTRILQTDIISVDPIEIADAQMVYIAYSNINNFFFERYGDFSYFHYASVHLPALCTIGNGVFLEAMSSHFYLTVLEDNRVLAHNIFPQEQEEDILYYTLFALEQYKLDPETLQLTLVQKEQNLKLFDFLFTYIRNVEVIKDYPAYLNKPYMRIISGIHKGRRIQAPKNLPVRPTTDMAKEALFNILRNLIHINGIKVLELFAGSGNMSYEFASRGAGSVLSVDHHFPCITFIKKTAEQLDLPIDTIKADAFKFLENHTIKYDIIFADPPYGLEVGDFLKIPELVTTNKLLKEDGILIIEHSKHTDLSGHPSFDNARRYGGTVFSFFLSTSSSEEE